jgi:hypothetical protein
MGLSAGWGVYGVDKENGVIRTRFFDFCISYYSYLKTVTRLMERSAMWLPESPTALRRLRQASLRQLPDTGFVLSGNLVRFPRYTSLYLTNKVRGKTRTLYIPLNRLDGVKQWNANYTAVRLFVRELS